MSGGLGLLLLGLLGLVLGSFLNVVIHRLPRGLSLWRPRSRCPRCGTPIAVRDNLPVLSYLMLRGRCRACRRPIRARYLWVELLGAGALLLAGVTAPTVHAAAVRGVFLLALVVVAFIDAEHGLIPDEISLGGIVVGVLVASLQGMSQAAALLGVACGAGGFLLAIGLYRIWRGRAGLGWGDVKLAAMVGAFLGPGGVLLAVFLASLAGAVLGIALVLRRRATWQSPLPFGTFLAPAAAVVCLWQESLLAFGRRVLGL